MGRSAFNRGGPLACASLAALVIAACATTPPLPPADWNRAKAERQQLERWQMKGRAAVATANDGWTASVAWNQDSSHSELQLHGALGVGGVHVKSDGQAVEIETSKGERINSDDAQAALQQTIGIALPLGSLRYWLLGVPDPALPAVEELDDRGRLSRLEQDGWQATYDRYAYQNEAWLPGRMRLEKGPVRVRVVVDQWRF
ncbi:MAG TPA: lipoprotein insertase outer membrane protein LolB [Steroidobacteraceae bacterium]|nr:lipoprotein insertase outer membrane protein LolB [Steroidobacteraceae bacterium]